MTHPRSLPTAFSHGNVAVVTGAASGIGLAAAGQLAALGMKVVLADLGGQALDEAAEQVLASSGAAPGDVLAVTTDVSRRDDLVRLRDIVHQRFGSLSVLMNNAGAGDNPGLPWENSQGWKSLMDVNLWGVVHGTEAFVPGMLAESGPAIVINTGSKQGITSPPGNAAYNVSKAAVKAFTEALAHALRVASGDRISAHLLIPGYTFTKMTGLTEKPESAWTADQVVEYMLDAVAAGDFYILCPDNAVDRATDERRIRWAAEDIILNRPALSRWHPDFQEAFARYLASDSER